MSIRQFEPLWGVWRTEEKPLGQGSFGVVYRAWREEFGKKYYAAVKHISIPASEAQISDAISEGVADTNESLRNYFASITQNFSSEISYMSEVKGHTNIVSYEDHLIIPKPSGIGYDIIIRMELLTGLNDMLRHRRMTDRDVIKLGIDICSALEVCLEKGIVHRDIKPSNIFVNDLGDYKLGDFGVARQLGRTTIGMSKKGTYVYMAPEVYRGEPANFSADTFSLGIVMYRLLNGNRAPFLPVGTASISSADNEVALARRMSGEPLPAPAFASRELADIILRATRFNRAERFASPTEFKQALISLRDGVPAARSIPFFASPAGDSLYPPPHAVTPVNTPPYTEPIRRAAPMPAAPVYNNVPVSSPPDIGTGRKKSSLWIWLSAAAAVLLAAVIAVVLLLPDSTQAYGPSMMCEDEDWVYYYNGDTIMRMSHDRSVSEPMDWFAVQIAPYEDSVVALSMYSIDLLDENGVYNIVDIEELVEGGSCSYFCLDGSTLYYIVDYELNPDDDTWTDQRSIIYSTDIETGVTDWLLELEDEEYPLIYGDLHCDNGKLYFVSEMTGDEESGEGPLVGVWKLDLRTGEAKVVTGFAAAEVSDACVFTDDRIIGRSYYYIEVYDYDGNLLSTYETSDPTYGYSYVVGDKFIYGSELVIGSEEDRYMVNDGIYAMDISSGGRMKSTCIFDGKCDIIGAAGEWIYFLDYSGLVDFTEKSWWDYPICRIRADGSGYMQMP